MRREVGGSQGTKEDLTRYPIVPSEFQAMRMYYLLKTIFFYTFKNNDEGLNQCPCDGNRKKGAGEIFRTEKSTNHRFTFLILCNQRSGLKQ